jgi:hypothetical protein
LLLFLPLQLESLEVLLVVFVTLKLLVLAQNTSVFLQNVLFQIFFLFLGLYFTNGDVNFLVDDNMELLVFFGNVASQKDVQSHLHVFGILAINLFNQLPAVLASKHFVYLQHIVFVLNRQDWS